MAEIEARWHHLPALNTGGMLVDHGWLRVYGGCGTAGGMQGLAEVNEFPAEPTPSGVPPEGLVIGHDILGGVFALNLATSPASGRPGEPGEVVYFAPDSLRLGADGRRVRLLADLDVLSDAFNRFTRACAGPAGRQRPPRSIRCRD